MTDAGNPQPAGWYHAQGDPPGTQRYWDGASWIGGPRAITQDGPSDAGAQTVVAGGRRPASAGTRFIAFLIDFGIVFGIYLVGFILISIAGAISDALGGVAVAIVVIAALGYWIYNFVYLQGTTGQTIGKRQRGVALLRQVDGQPTGPGMTFLRLLLSGLIASLCYLDHWWILVDENNQRLSDKVFDFNVYDV